jgi:hypothetical protein
MGGGSQSQPIRDSLAVYLLPPKCRPSRMCQLGRQRCTIKFLLFLAVACCCLCRSCFDWVSARSTALSLLWTALFLRIDSWSSSRALAALSSKFSGKLTTSIVTVSCGSGPCTWDSLYQKARAYSPSAVSFGPCTWDFLYCKARTYSPSAVGFGPCTWDSLYCKARAYSPNAVGFGPCPWDSLYRKARAYSPNAVGSTPCSWDTVARHSITCVIPLSPGWKAKKSHEW